MKKLKKLAGILLALVIVFSMTATAYAETVDNKTTHSYVTYKIFSGTQAEDSYNLGDIQWGDGIQNVEFLSALKIDSRFVVNGTNIFASCTTAAEVAAALGGYTTYDNDIAKAFADLAVKYKGTMGSTIIGAQTSVSLEPGYYLIVDTYNASGMKDDALNSALLQVTNNGPITITAKYTVPTVEKEVTGSTTGSASYEIGDDVPFTLTGTMPENLSDYDTYKYIFTDTMSDTLKYNGNVQVYVKNGETETLISASNYTVTPSGAATSGGGTLKVEFNNIKTVANVAKDSKIIVKYTAELLSTAVSGTTGNSNKVTLAYSNDPNTDGSGTTGSTDTPEKSVKVFTYTLKVNKVDGQNTNKKLTGAEFVLWNSDRTKVAKVSNGTFVEWVTPTSKNDGTYTYPTGTVLTSTSNEFTVKGLKAATYILSETKAPAGYNTLKDDIKLIIKESLTEDTTKEMKLNGLSMEVVNGTVTTVVTGDTTTGTVTTNVANNAGAQLPETGGMGTTLFYIVGAALALSAVVLLVTKKRMSGAEK